MLYRVQGVLEVPVLSHCSCEFCEGHWDMELADEKVDVVVEAGCEEDAIWRAECQVLHKIGADHISVSYLDWPVLPQVTEAPEHHFMQRVNAPTLFDLEEVK